MSLFPEGARNNQETAMSTTLHYNGITLKECETKLFEQQVEYDPSVPTKCLRGFAFRVSSLLVYGPTTGETRDQSHIQTPGEDGYDISSRMRSIEARLLHPRKDFWLELTTQKVISGFASNLICAAGDLRGTMKKFQATDVADEDNTEFQRELIIDVDNGPKPRHVSVTQVFGGNSIHVEFEIEVCRVLFFGSQLDEDQYPWQVPSGHITPAIQNTLTPNPANPLEPFTMVPVLSNRWSMTETRDASWRIERKISGILRVKHSAYFAHSMRFLCMPGLQRGFQRKVCNWIGDPTGLTLKYEIVDVQRDAAPPPPAVDWKGSVHSTGDKGGSTIIHVSLSMIGQPGVNKSELLAAGGYIVGQKVPGLLARLESEKDENNDPYLVNAILENVAIYVSLDEPMVKLDVTARTVIEDYKQLATSMKYITSPLTVRRDEEDRVTYDPQRWPIPLPMSGMAPQNIFSCYLQNPYSVWHGIPKPISYQSPSISSAVPNNRPDAEEGYGYDNYYMQDSEIQDSKDDRQLTTTEQLTQNPVTFYFVKNTYDNDAGLIQLERSIVPPIVEPPDPEAEDYDPNAIPEYDPQYDTCRFVQLHGGRATRTMRVEAKRIGKKPQLPEPTPDLVDPNGIRERLMFVQHELVNPQFTKDLVTREFSVAATYTYGLSRPPQKWEKLRMATSPFDTLTPTAALVDQTEAYAATANIEWREPVDEEA